MPTARLIDQPGGVQGRYLRDSEQPSSALVPRQGDGPAGELYTSMITIALAGKPNCGKSTFFKAATLADAEIANYPFTTIDANHGVAYVRVPCQCKEMKVSCGVCQEGFRFIPVNLIDVAGLVPLAHTGRGLGNQFLDNLRQADAIIHVVDASGATDAEGNPVDLGSHDPVGDITFLTHEMTMWFYGIVEKHWSRLLRTAQSKPAVLTAGLADVVAGLGITIEDVQYVEKETGVDLIHANTEQLIAFCEQLLLQTKPMLIIGNKADLADETLRARLTEEKIPLVSGATELALRNAEKSHLIHYLPGDSTFTVPEGAVLNAPQKKALQQMATVMKTLNGTGVQQMINRVVFELLDQIVVYPVEDENHLTDSRGRVLPDAFLLKKGSTARELAFRVHSDIGKGFLYAIDAKSKMRIKDSQQLKEGDIIRIVSIAK